MEKRDVLLELNQLFTRIFGDKTYQLNDHSSAVDIPLWDSLNHIQVITAIEERFGVQFSNQEIMRFRSIGAIRAAVEGKLGGK
jgi:acyl carrier protein